MRLTAHLALLLACLGIAASLEADLDNALEEILRGAETTAGSR